MTRTFSPGATVHVGGHAGSYIVDQYYAATDTYELTSVDYGTLAFAAASLVWDICRPDEDRNEVVIYDRDGILATFYRADSSVVIACPLAVVPTDLIKRLPSRYRCSDTTVDGGRVYQLFELS